MDESTLTVRHLVTKIGVYNKTLNNYLNTIEFSYKKDEFLYDTRVYDLRDYQPIKIEFYNFILSQKQAIIEYEKDYYAWKSIKDIAKKIEVDLSVVLEYLNKLDFTAPKSLFTSSPVFNSFIKIENKKYPIGNIIDGFFEDFKNNNAILKKDEHLFSLYKNKLLFTEDRELKQLSSYEVLKGINRMKLIQCMNIENSNL